MRFSDIKKVSVSHYNINVSWDYLEDHLERYTEKHHLDFNPDFQRDFVWTKKQKTQYIEYVLKGGYSGKDVFFNMPSWMDLFKGQMVIVDGKQRLNAVLEFLQNKIKAFGHFYSEYQGLMPSHCEFIFHINNLKDAKDIYRWYIDLNTGGTVHTDKEIDKVNDLIKKC